jgi:hypothetical protein
VREVIILHKLLKSLLVGVLILPSISTVSAASMPSSYNNLTSEEKKAFDKIYQQSSESTLQNVNVNYSTELSGLKDISSYHWTAWKKAAKGGSISKSANSGKGVGSGSYKGFTQKKIDSWKVDEKYINAIKKINKGKFPKDGNYTFPTDTSSSKLDWWVDEVGFYDIMGDPKYSKVTAKGYRTFNWTEKVRKESIKKNNESQDASTVEGDQALGSKEGFYTGWARDRGFAQIVGQSPEAVAKKICSNIEKEPIKTGEYKGRYNGACFVQFKNGNTVIKLNISIIPSKTNDGIGQGRLLYDIYFQWTEETTTISYETESHTSKQQIAQTVVARNAYASEIQKYGNFYLTPKSNVSSQKIKTRNTGFWYNINPYYHKGSASVTDEGSYGWTFSTNVSSGKSGTNIYAMLPIKYKFYTDIVDSHYYAPDVGNPPKDGSGGSNNGNNNNNGGNNGGDKPNGGDSNNPGGNGNNSNNGGNGNNNGNNGNSNNSGNGGHSSIGDKENSPMIHIEIDAKDEDGRVGTVRVPKMVHLYDIDKYRKK